MFFFLPFFLTLIVRIFFRKMYDAVRLGWSILRQKIAVFFIRPDVKKFFLHYYPFKKKISVLYTIL